MALPALHHRLEHVDEGGDARKEHGQEEEHGKQLAHGHLLEHGGQRDNLFQYKTDESQQFDNPFPTRPKPQTNNNKKDYRSKERIKETMKEIMKEAQKRTIKAEKKEEKKQ